MPDGGGRRAQDVWFRFAMVGVLSRATMATANPFTLTLTLTLTQVECAQQGDDGYGGGACHLTSHQYWENYW